MMETTRDAATNAKTVLGYNLPATFADLEDGSEAKEMVKHGNFYGIAMKIIEMYESGSFPVPDSSNLLADFMDGSNKAIVEDTQVGGDENSYPQAFNYNQKKLQQKFNRTTQREARAEANKQQQLEEKISRRNQLTPMDLTPTQTSPPITLQQFSLD